MQLFSDLFIVIQHCCSTVTDMIQFFNCPGGGRSLTQDANEPPVPIHIVTEPLQLPADFLNPSPEKKLVIGFDCEGVDLCRHGKLCIMQV